MGLESFDLLVTCYSTNKPVELDLSDVENIKRWLLKNFPTLYVDSRHLDTMPYSISNSEFFLISHTQNGIFQVRANSTSEKKTDFFVRFALCNPVGVFNEVTRFVNFLMSVFNAHLLIFTIGSKSHDRDFYDWDAARIPLQTAMWSAKQAWRDMGGLQDKILTCEEASKTYFG